MRIYRKFQKNLHPSLSVSDVYGGDNTTFVQLWYSQSASTTPQEQFFCSADTCSQSNDTSTSQISWSCSNLRCSCISGTSFCGGPLDLTNTINGLSGILDIDCASNATTCEFKQATLQQLFGPNGLGLSGCTFGECVSSSVVDQLSGVGTTTSSNNSLSGGVIAGLAVVGALLLATAALYVIGLLAQRRARRGGSKQLDEFQPAGMAWSGISYSLSIGKGQAITSFFRRHNARTIQASNLMNGSISEEKEAGIAHRRRDGQNGKVILDTISGSLCYGGLMAILGPSGAGKSCACSSLLS